MKKGVKQRKAKVQGAKGIKRIDLKFSTEIAQKVLVERRSRVDVANSERISLATITRALKFAEDKGIIRYSIDEAGRPWIDDSLGRQLCEVFDLSHAIVVKDSGQVYEPSHDDRLHNLLGKALGDYLHMSLRPDDHLLTVGGRGTYFVGAHLNSAYRQKKNVSVTAISGRMATEIHARDGAFSIPSVDADDAAFLLAKSLCSNFGKFHPLNQRVAYSPEYADRLHDFSALLDERGELKGSSTICLCGVGQVGGNHMFMRHGDIRLAPIATELKELLKLLAQGGHKITQENGEFYPIGDIANRLFLATEINGRNALSRLQNLIKQINRKIVGLTLKQLSTATMVIINAGGLHKYLAIRKTLSFRRESGKPFVDVLCTDSQVARQLLLDQGQEYTRIDELPGETQV